MFHSRRCLKSFIFHRSFPILFVQCSILSWIVYVIFCFILISRKFAYRTHQSERFSNIWFDDIGRTLLTYCLFILDPRFTYHKSRDKTCTAINSCTHRYNNVKVFGQKLVRTWNVPCMIFMVHSNVRLVLCVIFAWKSRP